MGDQEPVLNKIKQVIAAAEQFKEEQFRVVLEGLVKRGGREAEFLLVNYMTSNKIPAETRANIIRCTGYLQGANYLVPLKKVIDQEPNIHLKKAAIISLAKFRSQRALNILNGALQTIKNPYLLSTINEQISQIKKDNPILALLPRFLKGDKDIKAFRVVMDILKKILEPADATIFVGYLKSEDPGIARGAFELLCSNGDRTIQAELFEFFRKYVLESNQELVPNDLLAVTKYLSVFLNRFPSLIYPQLELLAATYRKVNDIAVKKVVIAVICHCRAPVALDFIKEIYEVSDDQVKECIIEESSSNENAVDFLFEKYMSGKVLKEKVVKALMNSQKGFDYFSQHFQGFEPELQEMIVKNLSLETQPGMELFIKTLFDSGRTPVIKYLLDRVKKNYLFSFRQLLFDPARVKGFIDVEEDYLSTITQLFPISAVKYLLDRLATDEIEVGRMELYFNYLQTITRMEPILVFPESSLLSLLIIKIINANSIDLNALFLDCMEQIKTFDMATYKSFYEAINFFSIQRGENLVDTERAAFKQVRDNFQSIVSDLKSIEALEKEIKLALLKDVPDLMHLRKVIVSHHIGAAFKIRPLIRFIAEYFNNIDTKYIPNWREFFKEFPLIAQLVKEARGTNLQSKSEETEWSKYKKKEEESFFDKLRIVISFQDNNIIAIFKDQFNEILPEVTLCFDNPVLEYTDILLCDSRALKEYIEQNNLNTKRIFVLLDNRSEFATFKSLNPRAFFRPFSVYRVIKLILQEMYLLRT